MVEQLIRNEKVEGSSPFIGTNRIIRQPQQDSGEPSKIRGFKLLAVHTYSYYFRQAHALFAIPSRNSPSIKIGGEALKDGVLK